MSFPFKTDKMIEAAATLLRHEHGRKMSKKRLLAILYIADRLSFESVGRPIIGGRLVAMPYGPIHSTALDVINGLKFDDPDWGKRFRLDGYFVRLTNDPGAHHLSRFEVELLADLQRKYAGYDDWDVADDTHNFSEYKEVWNSLPESQRSGTIPLEKLLEAIGRAGDKQAILQTADEIMYYDSLFPERTSE